MAYKNKKGWYKVLNKEKVIKPSDNYMQSFNESGNDVYLEYKSSLEKIAIRYCDFNKHILRYSVEPFHIKYFNPVKGKQSRYFIDLYIEFDTLEKDKFIVEVKSKSETIPPKKPTKKTEKSIFNYQKALQTFAVNQAKWKAAEEFAKLNKMKFLILTEDELK